MERIKKGVIILYNQPKDSKDSSFKESELDVLHQVKAVENSLKILNISCKSVGISSLSELSKLSSMPEEIVFNLVEGLEGENHPENLVPKTLTSMGKIYTGNSRVSLNKWDTKNILFSHKIPVPIGTLVPLGEGIEKIQFSGKRLIVKPVMKDGSEGIDSSSVVSSISELRREVENIHKQLGQDALVEQFIEGRELNVSVLQDKGKVTVMPLAEIDFSKFDSSKPKIVGYSAKWLEDTFEFNNTPRILPADLPENIAEEVRKQVLSSWKAMECSGYVRVDLRLDQDLKPYILEVNLNPCIAPDSGFAAAIEKAGISYSEFILKSIETAIYEFEKDKKIHVKPTVAEDKESILDLVKQTQFFHDHEVLIAEEVLRDAIRDGPTGHYKSYTAEIDGNPVGWICFGQVPCTLGTFDIYWIAVSPRFQKNGVGSILLKKAEKEILETNGRVLVIETSGNEKYNLTRKFYEKNGYTEKARIHDFYHIGDDKVMYVKYIQSSKNNP